MEVREAASSASLSKASVDNSLEPKVAIYFFGDAFCSPFDLSQLSQQTTENGIIMP